MSTLQFVFVGDTEVGTSLTANLVSGGFQAAADLAAADVVFTYCVSNADLETVYYESKGLLATTKENVVFIDLSASSVGFAKEAYALARVGERQFVDAPLVLRDMCDHDAFGNRDNISVFVGAEDDVFATVEPMLSALAARVRHMGAPGSGQLAKTMVTLQTAAQLVSLIEAHSLLSAQKGTIGAAAIEAACEDGLITRHAASVYHAIEERHFHGTYTAQVVMAELEGVMLSADDADLVLPQLESAFQLVGLFQVLGGAALCAPALALTYGNEEDGKRFGLDWNRAKDFFNGHGDGCDCGDDGCDDPDCDCDHHHHHHQYEEEDPYGYAGYGSYDDVSEYPEYGITREQYLNRGIDEDFLGGYGDYSAN